MDLQERREGFTVIEVMVTAAIIAIIAAFGAFQIARSAADQRVKGTARSVADLLMLARAEAIRTGQNHAVLFQLDTAGSALQNADGDTVAGLVIRDADADGSIDAGEEVESVPLDTTNSVAWGSSFALTPGAEVPAPNDNAAASFPLAADFRCCTFTQPGGGAARWIVFLPDGTPRGFSVGPFNPGVVGTGNGAVYLTSGSRDYAVVLSALGGFRVHAWDRGAGAWTQ